MTSSLPRFAACALAVASASLIGLALPAVSLADIDPGPIGPGGVVGPVGPGPIGPGGIVGPVGPGPVGPGGIVGPVGPGPVGPGL